MSTPTVAVTCNSSDQGGSSVAFGVYTAKLDQTEIYDGFVVPESITVTADVNGVAVLNLWPNALGVNGSSYRVTARNPDTGKKFFDASVVVPNNPCNLFQIIQNAPFPNVDSAQQALIDVQALVAIVNQDVLAADDDRVAAEIAAAYALTRSADAALSKYNASLSEIDAEAAATQAAASQAALERSYPGTYTSDPVTRPGGGVVQVGDTAYINGLTRRWNGATWQASDINTANLAASGGSALVGFLQAGTGAVARTQQAKQRDVVSVKDFGAVGNGVTDDTAAIQAALTYIYGLAAPSGWRYNTATLSFPAGIYMVKQANVLFAGLGALSVRIAGAGKSGGTEIIYSVAAPASTDYMINNNNVFGFTQFENIKFTCANPGGANQSFMNYRSTGTAQNLTFQSCNFFDWTNLFDVGNIANASENTFFNCKFYNISGVGFALSNTQSVNWRFYACDAENITGTLFQFMQGATIYWSQGSIIPAGTAGRVMKIPSGADSNFFGPGNTPNVLFHGTRFEMRTGSLMVEKVNSPTKFSVIFDGCGMGGGNVTNPTAWKMFTWVGAGKIDINCCDNLINYRFSHSVAGTSDQQLFVKMTNSDAPKEFITASTFTVTGGSPNNAGYTPLFDIQACNSQIDGKYRVKDSEYNASAGVNYRGVVKELHGLSFSPEAKALAITSGSTFTVYVPPTRVLGVEIYPVANVSGAGNATVTVKNAAGTVTLATLTWSLTAPASVKLSADCNYLVDALAGDYLTVQFAHSYTPGVVQSFFGQMYLKY